MIEVVYNGGLGNNLFQYCFGRILAERLGYRLQAEPIPGFVGTFDRVEGASYAGLNTITLRGQKPDLRFLGDANQIKRHILLTGYFQRFEYYKPHAARIRHWLRLDDHIDAPIGEADIAMSIRRGKDYVPRYGLPLSFYEQALHSSSYSRVYICTNEPRDPFIRYFEKKYGAVVRPGGFQGGQLGPTYLSDAIDNLVFLKKFKKLVVSNSSFAWWAGFLSNASEIFYPRPWSGMWAKNDPISKNMDLEVDDERYRYIECAPYRSEFLSEQARVFFERAVSQIKSAIRPHVAPTRAAPARDELAYRFEEE